MSEPKHTPGPWKHRPVEFAGVLIRDQVVAADGAIITDDVSRPEDAALIAATPDLLAIVQQEAAHYERYTDEELQEALAPDELAYVKALRAAIAKAEGQQ